MQEEIRCPYCELKKVAKQKMVFKATNPIDGECPGCGALLDVGQKEVKFNDLLSIYEGACDLLDVAVDWFNGLLKEYDVELEEDTEFCINTSMIIESLFVRGYGGTTKRNVQRTLGIKDDYYERKISKDEAEEW